ncbi:hypothetical protein LC608_31545 [Nostoc sp. XA010]|uniref:hypothetical protein n=1 Tax=Nostoc sp. XA010 TaxID=2780407 RepID=UPI001E3B6F7C|nr:hypothetical protein [Nostoc sp. XA010]MCC5661408.1 hypothetical protein [Nostoc sp. XA010]
MLDINRVLKEDRLLRAFTGLNRKAFDELSQGLEIVLNQEAMPAAGYAYAKKQKPRKRRVGGGRKARLQRVEDKLFFILFYSTSSVIRPLM